MKILDIFKPAPHIARLPDQQVALAYKKFQLQNVIGIYLGYACYYFLRSNFSLAMPYLRDTGYSKAQLGLVLSALTVAYGISKFIMGNLSDRSNPRYFLVAGLIVSIIANLIFGFVPGVVTSFAMMYLLMFISGWAQGMGAPPCYRTVAHWFPVSARGRIMAIWNTSHNVGAGLLGLLATIIIPVLAWPSIFYIPSLVVTVLAVVLIACMRDTPQSVGLMPVEEYSKESVADNKIVDGNERELTAKEILFKYVLVNKYMWFLSLANIFVYFIRYGVLNWAPTYLAEVKGLELAHTGYSFVVYEGAGIAGILLCGYMSDKFFHGRRAPVSILCMAIVLIGVLLYWLSDNIFVIHGALFLIGTFIYGPVMLVGVQMLDIMPKKAVGTGIGLLGLFGYWGGAMAATAGFGYVVDSFSWNGGFIVLAVSCVLAMGFFALTLGIKYNKAK